MSDEELFVKGKPLWALEDTKTIYDLPSDSDVYETTTSYVIERKTDHQSTIPLTYDQYKDDCDLRMLNNIQFRKKISNMIHTVGHLHGIFPHFVRAFYPRVNLMVEYPREQLVYWGNELGPKLIVEEPRVTYQTLVPHYWTLIFVGQEKNRPEVQYDHWIVGNILSTDIKNGQVLSEYIPATPFLNGGLHVYVYLLCQQKEKISFDDTRSSQLKERDNFNLEKFMRKYDLIPKGICFFSSKWSPQVPGLPELLNKSSLRVLTSERTAN